jgi:hypothetical protein
MGSMSIAFNAPLISVADVVPGALLLRSSLVVAAATTCCCCCCCCVLLQWDAEVRDRALGLVEDFGRGLPMPAYKEAYESLLVSDWGEWE